MLCPNSNCGKLVCGACSANKRKLTKLKMDKPVRVCTFCNDWLQQGAKDSDGHDGEEQGSTASALKGAAEKEKDNNSGKEKGSGILGFKKPSLGRLNSVKHLGGGGGGEEAGTNSNSHSHNGDHLHPSNTNKKKPKKISESATPLPVMPMVDAKVPQRKGTDARAFSYDGGPSTLDRRWKQFQSSPAFSAHDLALSDTALPTRKTIFGRKKKAKVAESEPTATPSPKPSPRATLRPQHPKNGPAGSPPPITRPPTHPVLSSPSIPTRLPPRSVSATNSNQEGQTKASDNDASLTSSRDNNPKQQQTQNGLRSNHDTLPSTKSQQQNRRPPPRPPRVMGGSSIF